MRGHWKGEKMPRREIWKPIPDFKGYEVSNEGRVRSYFKRAYYTWVIADTPQRILKPSRDPNGYPGVNLQKDGVGHRRRIHQLIMLAFVGPCPNGLEICHNNGIPNDNWLENLRYDTPSENQRDAARNGSRRLLPEQVKTLREMYWIEKANIHIIVDKFGMRASSIRNIAHGNCYSYCDGPMRGERRKLAKVDASEIQAVHAIGNVTMTKLAEQYGVSLSMISRVISGER